MWKLLLFLSLFASAAHAQLIDDFTEFQTLKPEILREIMQRGISMKEIRWHKQLTTGKVDSTLTRIYYAWSPDSTLICHVYFGRKEKILDSSYIELMRNGIRKFWIDRGDTNVRMISADTLLRIQRDISGEVSSKSYFALLDRSSISYGTDRSQTISRWHVTPEGWLLSAETYRIDRDGQTSTLKDYRYEYDHYGRVLYSKERTATSILEKRTEYTYANNHWRRKQYRSRDSLILRLSDSTAGFMSDTVYERGKAHKVIDREYDRKNRLLEKRELWLYDRAMNRWRYDYDDRGLLKKETEWVHGEIDEWTDYLYEFE